VTPDPTSIWLDHQEPAAVYAAAGEVAKHPELTGRLAEAGGDGYYAVWLALVDGHMARLLATSRAELRRWDWRGAYHTGLSPRTAAVAAFADRQSTPLPTSLPPPAAPDWGPPAPDMS
jgi:hypothetical protein